MTSSTAPELDLPNDPRLPLPRFVWRLLTLRLTRDQFFHMSRHHFFLGIVSVWIVGMGRWWDDPTASLAQHLGLGSIIYVFILAGAIWLIFLPLRPARWRYSEILTLVTLTSFPGILYAIPVERFTSPDISLALNVSLLALVATWRLAIVWTFLRRHAQLSVDRSLAGLAFPAFAILTVLAFLNALGEMVRVMGGVRPPHQFGMADLIGWFAVGAAVSFVGYMVSVVRAEQRPRKRPAGNL